MIIETTNKNTVPFAVLCDVAEIDASFHFSGCKKKEQLVQHVTQNSDGKALINISDEQADRFIELFEHLENNTDSMPDAAVDDFLYCREVYLAIKQERNLNND